MQLQTPFCAKMHEGKKRCCIRPPLGIPRALGFQNLEKQADTPRCPPPQEYLDGTQGMVKELHNVHGSVLSRLSVLEQGASSSAGGGGGGGGDVGGPAAPTADGQGPSSEELQAIQVGF